MKTVEVIRQHIYARRNRRVGQVYEASERDIPLLERMRLIKVLQPPAPQPQPQPQPKRKKTEPPPLPPPPAEEPPPPAAVPTPQVPIESVTETPAPWFDPYREVGMDREPASQPEPQPETDEERKRKKKYKRRDLEAEGD